MFIEIKAMMKIGYIMIGSLSVCYINTSYKLDLLKACFLRRILLRMYVRSRKSSSITSIPNNWKLITYKIYNYTMPQ